MATQVWASAEARAITDDTSTERLIEWTLRRFGSRRIALTTSFGLEGCALIDMYAAHRVSLTVIYLDTMFFFPETYDLRDRMAARYPHLTFVNRGTRISPEEQERRFGPELWRRHPDTCCRLRKVEPMRRALSGMDIWVTAVTRQQSSTRAATPLIGWDPQFQLLKAAPLAHWSRDRILEYIGAHDVPFNALHDRGYPSVGCTHCTAPVAGLRPGEYSRAGRWAGTGKTECGLHVLTPR